MNKKKSRGAAYCEGCMVRSSRDNGEAGVVIGMTHRRGGWCYTVQMVVSDRIVTRAENELEEIKD